ncbi:MAG: tRNA epoxyqueuosine(34) reductase QueG [Bacteroidales bacterium]|nr:tRNA epoxyqueuosine(34) reductase QueG [Bacteroidales bacterium]
MTDTGDKAISLLIKEKAYNMGFDLCGIAPARILEEHESIIKSWCSSGMNGMITYLGQNIKKRINPALQVPGAKSVIVTGLNYYADKKQGGDGIPVISRYAYGKDYHEVIKGKLNEILDYILILNPGAKGKCFVDSSSVLEKAWAREAGLGWPGRHSILINKNIGSFFFLGVIMLDIVVDYDEPVREDHCGKCRLCIDSCPTGAINENRTLDVRKCIAYLTIESKNPVPEDIIPKMGGRIYGCDKCQEVCPWNENAKPNRTLEFQISDGLKKMTTEDWLNLTSEQFDRLFKNTPVRRRTYERFMRNITSVTKSDS